MKLRELTAVILSITGIAAVAILPFWYEKQRTADAKGVRTIELTGVAPKGVWTEDKVTGANYWETNFTPADIRLEKGEEIRLILRSADVVHRFYLPELGIGPIELVPGHTEEVRFKADKVGTFTCLCTAMCSDCHFFMHSLISVGSDLMAAPRGICLLSHDAPPPDTLTTMAEKGGYWFQTKGCMTCHGAEGSGGVTNFNYAKGTVPALNTLADRMFLQSKDDVETFTKVLEETKDPSQLKQVPGLSNWTLVQAQYKAVVKTIQEGSAPAKADPNLPDPPLFMPSWKEKLDQNQINSILAYLVSLQKFEEHTGWGN
jgi:mono/diheme cytochrome c family protein